jgi:hypothetical protein
LPASQRPFIGQKIQAQRVGHAGSINRVGLAETRKPLGMDFLRYAVHMPLDIAE